MTTLDTTELSREAQVLGKALSYGLNTTQAAALTTTGLTTLTTNQISGMTTTQIAALNTTLGNVDQIASILNTLKVTG